MHIEILSPKTFLFSEDATRISLPATNGRFEVLEGHAPLISVLAAGNIVLTLPSGGKKEIPIKGGFVKVEQGGKMVVLVQ